ncbi:MAG: glycosyltransferase [Beijerinckiaceae bacterium]|nr:glycosyltransferase [Beijerinckiaceae bacterium]MCI0736529.1 glycosyltransferase [Beijerinckiaceae bacterium]
MELILLDSGLMNKAGHSYTLAKTVSRALTARKVRHRIFGLRCLDTSIAAEIGAIPHFCRSLYDSEDFSWGEKRLRSMTALIQGAPAGRPAKSERRSWKKLNENFERDLRSLPVEVWYPDNLICIVAISQNQLLGLVRFLRAMPRGRLPRVACQLMFPPSFVPWGAVSSFGEQFYREAFELVAPLVDLSLFFTVENEAMRAAYQKDFGLPTRILPVPFGAPLPQGTAADRVRLGFFGDSKCDKGFHLLPKAIVLCQQGRLDAEFVIQIQHSSWEQRTIEAERALRCLKGVRFLDGILSAEDYTRWTSQMDVMLLPYDPIAFGPARGSGIFTEALAAGRPVVATLGTFAGDTIGSHNAEGEVFAPHTSEALAAAISRLLPRLPACKARAADRAKKFALSHSPDAYVDVLLELANR